jgi:hypothetical protein
MSAGPPAVRYPSPPTLNKIKIFETNEKKIRKNMEKNLY